MARILIVYGTSYGHTGRIVARMSERMMREGHQVTTWRADQSPLEPSLRSFDRCLLAGSVLFGRYQRALRRFAEAHRDQLNRMPTAFVSVCGALAGGTAEGNAEAQKYVDRFLKETGWRPGAVRGFAGAVAYTRYGFFTRWIMKSISRRTGRPTDTSRDWDFTDWNAVEEFAVEFAGAGAVAGAGAGK